MTRFTLIYPLSVGSFGNERAILLSGDLNDPFEPILQGNTVGDPRSTLAGTLLTYIFRTWLARHRTIITR